MHPTRFLRGRSVWLLVTWLLTFPVFGQSTGTNVWTKPASGYWEEMFWSLGQLPNRDQAGVVFSNPGFKALAIGANTTAQFPGSLWIRNLLVASPPGSANQLLLNYPGLAVPLRIDADLRVETNSSLVSYFASLRGASFYLGGVATFDQLSEADFSSQVAVGAGGSPGELNVLSGSFNAARLVLSFDGSAGKLNQSGGRIQLGSLAMNRQSTLNLSNGTLRAGSLEMIPDGTGTVAAAHLFGGSMTISNLVQIGLGNIFIAGGHFLSPGINVFEGELRQTGGTNESGAIFLPQGRMVIGQGSYFLSGGVLLSSNVTLGASAPGGFAGLNGVFEQSGGVHNNSAGLLILGTIRTAEARPNGVYRLNGGLLVTPSIRSFTGSFTQSGGTNRAGTVILEETSFFTLSGGLLASSNVTIGLALGRPKGFRQLRSVYLQTGGSHAVADQFISVWGGLAQLQGGSLTAPNIRVGPESELELTGAVVTNSGTFTMLGGAQVRAEGTYPHLGKLIVSSGASLLDFGVNAATLRFRDSRDVAWDSTLVVTNWSGLTTGGGTDRLFVGTSSQGLTREQLALIRFVNPPGVPAGNYPAMILATGEVVPGPRPVLNVARSPQGVVISWSGHYQLLTSTNVAGPYTVIPGATSPYTSPTTEPHRFFALGLP